MIKFSATNKWYELAAKNETGIPTISAGPSLAISAFLGGEVDLKKDARELRKIEDEIRTKMSETEVRQLLDDKVTPMREDLKEIKDRIDVLLERIIKNSN